MTATQDILSQVASVHGGVAGAGRALEDQDLAALRKVLLAPERSQLRKILHRLDDPATRAAELASILPTAMALRNADDDQLTDTLAPLVRNALAGALRERPDLLAAAMRDALGSTLRAPWLALAAQLRAWRKNSARKSDPAKLQQLYLLRRETGELLEHAACATTVPDDANDEMRSVASMVTYLLTFLRDPGHLARYAAMGQLRIEQHTYGVCAGASVVVLSVICGQSGVEKVLRQTQELLMAIDQAMAGAAKTGKYPRQFLPNLAAQQETPVSPVSGG